MAVLQNRKKYGFSKSRPQPRAANRTRRFYSYPPPPPILINMPPDRFKSIYKVSSGTSGRRETSGEAIFKSILDNYEFIPASKPA